MLARAPRRRSPADAGAGACSPPTAAARASSPARAAAGLFAADRLEEITAEARRLVAAGRGRELMFLPGWWHVVSAGTFVDLLTELPDVVALAPAIRCPVLYLRGDQEPADLYPAEAFKAGAAGECTVGIVADCGHFYVGREDEVARRSRAGSRGRYSCRAQGEAEAVARRAGCRTFDRSPKGRVLQRRSKRLTLDGARSRRRPRPMSATTTLLDLVGNTPLVRLTRLRHRAVRALRQAREPEPGRVDQGPHRAGDDRGRERATGALPAGGTIVEATAGQHRDRARARRRAKGYRTVLVVPDKMSREKIQHLKALGAEVIMTRSDVGRATPSTTRTSPSASPPSGPARAT